MSFLRNWRYLLLSLVAIGAVAAFAACGGDDEGDGGGGDESPSAAAGERIDGGTMTVHPSSRRASTRTSRASRRTSLSSA